MGSFGERIGTGRRQSQYHRVAGSSKTTAKRRDDDGRLAGVQREHWDGRVDATVRARTVDFGRVSLRHDLGMSPSEAEEVIRLLQMRYGRLKPASQVSHQPRLVVPGRV